MQAVVVIGGGVVGCACAWALRRDGIQATILERGAASTESPGATGAASWAAAGILGAQIVAPPDADAMTPLARLALASRALYPPFAAEIEEATGLDVELRACGMLRPAFDEDTRYRFARATRWHLAAGLAVEHLDARAALELEPALARDVMGATWFACEARVDPPKLLAALRKALGPRLGAKVKRVVTTGGAASGVELEDGEVIGADAVVVAAGSWSSLVEGALPETSRVSPARGQIVEMAWDAPNLAHVIDGADVYLSPRDDGRVLVGSTVEHVGYELGADAKVTEELRARAVRVVPALAEAKVARAWTGFRPFVADGLPAIGATEVRGLYAATGHHRNGVLLAPVTGALVADLILGYRPMLDLAPFSPLRAVVKDLSA